MVTMSTSVGVRELRDNLTSLLRRVRAGETIEVTHHGRPVAVLSPAQEDRIAQLIARGGAEPAVPLDAPIRRGRPRRARGGSRAIEEDRGAR